MENSNDVELEALLKADSGEVETPVASDENIDNTQPVSEDVKTPSEESTRANERIRELVEEVKSLKQSQATQNSTDLDKFVNSIEDEPSRNLLKQFGNLVRQDIRREVDPVLQDYNVQKFDKEFSKFESIPELSVHKDELRKTFLRNPSQSLKGLVGEILVEAQTSKIKPIERAVSQASRTLPTLDDSVSKEDLYALLEQKPPIN
jgi:hypothetical protein